MATQTVYVGSISTPGSEPFNYEFTGLGGQGFDNFAAFKAEMLQPASDANFMGKLLFLWYLGIDPSMANPSILLNASITYDDVTGGLTIQVGE